MSSLRLAVFSLFILGATVACQAAARLIGGEAARPTAVLLHPSVTSTPEGYAASCTEELQSILRAGNEDSKHGLHSLALNLEQTVDYPLVTYAVQGDQIGEPVRGKFPGNLEGYADDTAAQGSAWRLFSAAIPAEWRQMVAQYQVISDGPGGILSAVEQTQENPETWVLEVDVADAADTKDLAFNLLHEYGHLLTLNASQVPPNLKIFHDPSSDRIYARAQADCPRYFPGDGCSLPNSYVNLFFQRFWPGLYKRWSTIDEIQDSDRRTRQLDAFYQEHRDLFVDSYAVTNPAEDIAESWAFFVLSGRPARTSIADEKLLFFYEFPELATLRGRIRQNLCQANP